MKTDKLNEYALELYNGDASAFKRIYDDSCRWVMKRVREKGIAAADVEDCTQEIYLKLYRSFHTFDPEKGKFRSWFNAMIERAIIDYWRGKRGSYQNETLTDWEMEDIEIFPSAEIRAAWAQVNPEVLPEQIMEKKDAARILKELTDNLTPLQKQCVTMRLYQGMKEREVAAALGVAVGTVKSATFSGKKRLAEQVTRLKKKGEISFHSLAPLPIFLFLMSQIDNDTFIKEKIWEEVNEEIGRGVAGAGEGAAGGAAGHASGTDITPTGSGESSTITMSSTSGTVKITGEAVSTAAGTAAASGSSKMIIGILAAAVLAGTSLATYHYCLERGIDKQPVAEAT